MKDCTEVWIVLGKRLIVVNAMIAHIGRTMSYSGGRKKYLREESEDRAELEQNKLWDTTKFF